MSQFNSNQDPLAAFSNFGPSGFGNAARRLLSSGFRQGGGSPGSRPGVTGGMGQRMGSSGGGMAQAPIQAPQAMRGRREFVPRAGGTMGIAAQYGGGRAPGTTFQFGGPDPQAMNMQQQLANAMATDMRNQQGAMNQMFQQGQQQTGLTEEALQRGIGTLQAAGAQQRANLQQIAAGVEGGAAQSQRDFDEFKAFRDQQMGQVGQDIAAANQQAAAAVSGYEKAIGQFRDTSAQDAANAAFGMRQNAQSRMAEIDMLDANPAEKAALKQQLMGDVSNQVTQSVTGIFSNMNQQIASMQGNLAGLRQSQAQQTLSGGQLRGQMGTAFGGQTLQAMQMNQQMGQQVRELGANIRMAGENAMASAMQQSVLFEMQGRQSVAEMIRQNPQQFVSMFAGLSGYLAGATTPGIENIAVPNFGAFA